VLLLWHLLNIFLSWHVACIVVVITVRMCNRVVSTRLVVLELVLLVLLEGRVEIFLLVRPVLVVSKGKLGVVHA
jgi:hypothetical protein